MWISVRLTGEPRTMSNASKSAGLGFREPSLIPLMMTISDEDDDARGRFTMV